MGDVAHDALAQLAQVHPDWRVPRTLAVPRAECTTTIATLDETADGSPFCITRHAADGILVVATGSAAGITVADCLAICLWAEERLAVLHGARACLAPPDGRPGIIAEAVHTGAFAPAATRAWVGAGIGACCYGLDTVPEGIPPFIVRRPTRGPRQNKPYALDLRALAAARLRSAGISADQITVDTRCTSCARTGDADTYWSHVRGDPERNLFVAWLEG